MMTTKIRDTFTLPAAALFVLLVCMLMTTIASAATISVLDEKLNLQIIRLQSLDDQAITFFDADGNYQTRQLTDFLQLRVAVDPVTSKHSSLYEKTDEQSAAALQPASPASSAPPAPSGDAPGQAPDGQPAAVAPAALVESAGPAVSPTPTSAIVELIDGQRLTGRLVGSDDAGQIMQWEHPQAGQMTFKLDHVRQWRFDASLPATTNTPNTPNTPNTTNTTNTPGSDRLLLANGDELLGFVSAVTATQVSFTPQGSEKGVDIERSRVRAIVLANAPLGSEQTKTLMTLADGSRLRVAGLVIERGQMRFGPALGLSGEMVSLDLSELRRLDFASERWQLMPWRELPRESQADVRVFTTQWPVHEDDGVLLMHAPARVVFNLPSDCVAVTARLALDVEPLDPGRAWADFMVTLEAGGEGVERAVLAEQVINEKSSQKRVRSVLPESKTGGWRTLILTLDPALNGPVMDRLRVTDAWVVVRKR